jgi:hypothetical protein
LAGKFSESSPFFPSAGIDLLKWKKTDDHFIKGFPQLFRSAPNPLFPLVPTFYIFEKGRPLVVVTAICQKVQRNFAGSKEVVKVMHGIRNVVSPIHQLRFDRSLSPAADKS